MKVTLTGTVTDVAEGAKGAKFVVVNDGEDGVAVRFWGPAIRETRSVAIGHTVRIEGRVKSREWQGKYYTDLNGETLVITGNAPGAGGAGGGGREEEPPLDEDQVPF